MSIMQCLIGIGKQNYYMTGIGPKIKSRRERLGWSTTKLATLAGISQSFLWRLESGKATGSWETYMKVAGALGVSIDVFFPNRSNVEEAPRDWREIPVLDYTQAALWTTVSYQIVDAEQQETIMANLEHPPSTFALRIRGDSMEPTFKQGDIVVIDPTIQPKPGDFIVANDASGEGTFKQYRHAGMNEKGQEVFELLPLNPLYAPMRSDRQQLAIVGTMVEHRSYRQR